MAKSIETKDKLQMTGEALGISKAAQLYKHLYRSALDRAAKKVGDLKGKTSDSQEDERKREQKDYLGDDMFTKLHGGKEPGTLSQDLWDRVANALGIDEVGARMLADCSAADFFRFIPEGIEKNTLRERSNLPGKEWLKEIVDAEQNPRLREEVFEQTEQLIHRSLTHNFVDKTTHWLESRMVDQKFMYLNLHSVENWRALLDDDSYLPYRHCCATLKALLEGDSWSREQESIDVVVILGAGTPEKELLIIQNLLKQKRFTEQKKLRVIIVDASVYMLVDTYEQIRQRLMRDGLDKRVEIVQCWADFNHMQPHLRHIRPDADRRRAAFFLMGGTIGNIDEGKFLASVRGISEPNDLLVISAEFVDKAPNRQKYLEELKKNYSGDHAKELVLEPIRGLLDKKGIVGDIRKRRDMVEAKLFADDPDLGPIDGTVGVMLCLEKFGLDLKLSRSKRYISHSFTEFFGRSFQLVATLPCAEFEPYHQVMFVRKSPLAE